MVMRIKWHFAALLVAMAVFFSGSAAQAQLLYGGTATATLTVTAEADLDDFWVVKVANTLGTAAATNGNYWTLPAMKGWLWRAVTNPGSPAPTDNYDIQLLDGQGADLFNGAANDRDTATSENTFPAVKTSVQYEPIYMSGPTYLSIVGNSQDDAQIETFLWIRKRIP